MAKSKKKKTKRTKKSKTATNKKSKATKAKTPAKGTKTAEAIKYITPFIKKGKYTQKELIDMTAENTDIAWSTAHMLIQKAKNPKYCKFDRVLKQDPETKKISF